MPAKAGLHIGIHKVIQGAGESLLDVGQEARVHDGQALRLEDADGVGGPLPDTRDVVWQQKVPETTERTVCFFSTFIWVHLGKIKHTYKIMRCFERYIAARVMVNIFLSAESKLF